VGRELKKVGKHLCRS